MYIYYNRSAYCPARLVYTNALRSCGSAPCTGVTLTHKHTTLTPFINLNFLSNDLRLKF